ncbi:MAG: hypothetical protein KZQ80_00915 [Candidatus Thiodiazotropha sp. (ex Monitilora ramsayi)]|nr:hypothetical protein [Candidatus Thiodiazotropha sp. (ex Monitilora ramsayi)]
MNNNSSDIDLLFAGFLVDEVTFELASKKEPAPQHAAHRYQHSLVRMLKRLPWASFNVLGTVPASTFPKNSNWLFKPKKWAVSGVEGYVLPIVNFPIIRLLSRFMGFFIFVLFWYFSRGNDKSTKKIIILYALHTPHLLPIFILRLFLNLKIIVYIPDLPAYMNAGLNFPFWKSWLKAIDSKILLGMANRVDGRIVITRNMFDYVNEKHSLVIDSISLKSELIDDQTNVLDAIASNIGTKYAVYAGGLNNSNRIKELVGIFLDPRIQSSGLNLVLCGQGTLSQWCLDMASQTKNVFYLGVLSNDKVVSLQKDATVLMNLRHTSDIYTKYSFPSKIAEYLQSGVPIMTTRLAGIPNDLVPYMKIVEDDPVITLCELLEHYDIAKSNAMHGQKYFMSSRSPDAQADIILHFINQIVLE